MFPDFFPNKQNLPYWIAAVAFSAAGFAFMELLNSERECAKREAEIQLYYRQQMREVIAECEAEKTKAMNELRQFMMESEAKYNKLKR